MRLEIDRKTISGRLAYAVASEGRPPRLAAEITAAEIDVDQMLASVARCSPARHSRRPARSRSRSRPATATFAGVEAKGVNAKLKFDPNGLLLERVTVADFGGAALNLKGRIEALATRAARQSRPRHRCPRARRRCRAAREVLPTRGRLAAGRSAAARAGEGPRHAAGRAGLAGGRAAGAHARAASPSTARPASVKIEMRADVAGNRLSPASGGTQSRRPDRSRRRPHARVGNRPRQSASRSTSARAGSASPRLGGLDAIRLDTRLVAGGVDLAANGAVRLSMEAVSGALDLSMTALDLTMFRRALVGPSRQPAPVTLKTRARPRQG